MSRWNVSGAVPGFTFLWGLNTGFCLKREMYQQCVCVGRFVKNKEVLKQLTLWLHSSAFLEPLRSVSRLNGSGAVTGLAFFGGR